MGQEAIKATANKEQVWSYYLSLELGTIKSNLRDVFVMELLIQYGKTTQSKYLQQSFVHAEG